MKIKQFQIIIIILEWIVTASMLFNFHELLVCKYLIIYFITIHLHITFFLFYDIIQYFYNLIQCIYLIFAI